MNNQLVGTNVRNRRKDIGMTQLELAQRLGLTTRTEINRIESGKKNITDGLLARLAQELDCTPQSLLQTPEERWGVQPTTGWYKVETERKLRVDDSGIAMIAPGDIVSIDARPHLDGDIVLVKIRERYLARRYFEKGTHLLYKDEVGSRDMVVSMRKPLNVVGVITAVTHEFARGEA